MEYINENELDESTKDKNPIKNEFYDLNSPILLKKIGSGSFGKVCQVKDKQTGEIYAAKILRQSIIGLTPNSIIDLFREVNINSKLYHQSIIKFIDYSPINFKNKPRPVLITEFAPNGSLADFIYLSQNSPSNLTFDNTLKMIIIDGITS